MQTYIVIAAAMLLALPGGALAEEGKASTEATVETFRELCTQHSHDVQVVQRHVGRNDVPGMRGCHRWELRKHGSAG